MIPSPLTCTLFLRSQSPSKLSKHTIIELTGKTRPPFQNRRAYECRQLYLTAPTLPRNPFLQPPRSKRDDPTSCVIGTGTDIDTDTNDDEENLGGLQYYDENDAEDQGEHISLDAKLRVRMKLKRARPKAPTSCSDDYLRSRGVKPKVVNWPAKGSGEK